LAGAFSGLSVFSTGAAVACGADFVGATPLLPDASGGGAGAGSGGAVGALDGLPLPAVDCASAVGSGE